MTSLVSDHEKVVGDFYSDFPYPWLAARLTRPHDPALHPSLLAQELGDFRHERLPVDARVWVAGCGVNQALMTALRFPGATVVGSDVSEESLRLCDMAAGQLGVTNLELREEGLTSAAYDDEFDLVICTGVVHHNPRPLDLMKRLRTALRPSGVAEVMVYNRFHRQEITAFQESLRLLGYQQDIWYAKRFARALSLDNALGADLAASLDESDEQFADTWLNPLEQSYTVAGLAELGRDAGLSLEAPCVSSVGRQHGAFLWETPVRDAKFDQPIAALDDVDRWQLCNLLLMNRSPYLWFYLRRTDNPVPALTEAGRDAAFLEAVLSPVTTPHTTWVLGATGGYRELDQTETPARPQSFQSVWESCDGQTPMRELLPAGADVRRIRTMLTTPEFPHLVSAR